MLNNVMWLKNSKYILVFYLVPNFKVKFYVKTKNLIFLKILF